MVKGKRIDKTNKEKANTIMRT